MITVEFHAEVTDGTIDIPEPHREKIHGPVRVTVTTARPTSGRDKVAELLAQPIPLPGFRPLGRDEAHERQ